MQWLDDQIWVWNVIADGSQWLGCYSEKRYYSPDNPDSNSPDNALVNDDTVATLAVKPTRVCSLFRRDRIF